MRDTTRRGAREGVVFGLISGIIFAMMEVAGAVMMGNPPLMPFRMFASVVLGQAAMESTPIETALIVGTAAHLALSVLFGLGYGLTNARLSAIAQTAWSRQVLLGLGYGAVVWFVNFQIIARVLYPWFLMAPQGLQLMMHALFFGLPLGLLYARAERRVHRFHEVPTQA